MPCAPATPTTSPTHSHRYVALLAKLQCLVLLCMPATPAARSRLLRGCADLPVWGTVDRGHYVKRASCTHCCTHAFLLVPVTRVV